MSAINVTADRRREVVGFDVGGSEDGAFWTRSRRAGHRDLTVTTVIPPRLTSHPWTSPSRRSLT